MSVPQAIIKGMEGEVTISRNGETLSVKEGDFLLPGDEIVTGATGRLALEFPAGEGQIPAAGVMTGNGKISLSEQTGPRGDQIVVIEDGECFEFTTELADNSAAADGGAVAGLFGAGLLGAGGGAMAAGGAVAAGAFLAGGSSDTGDSGAPAASSGAAGGSEGSTMPGLGNLGSAEFSSEDSPQSPEEFVNENLTQENLAESLVQPIQDAAQASQADLVQQLVDGINQTPLGEPLSPLTEPLVDAFNTDLGLDALLSALPTSELADGGLLTSLVGTVDGLTQPLSEALEPVDMLMGGLQDVAVEVDGLLANVAEGLLGGADTLQAALQGASGGGLPQIQEGDLLGTLSTGISSGADALGGALGGLPGLSTDGLTG